MFDEISLMAWMGGAIVFAIGSGAGFFIARQIKDKRTIELEQKLEATQNQLTEYRDEVDRHFLKTSLLFSKLTDNYRDVYEHLATGAQKLCNDKPQISALNLPEDKILSAAALTRSADSHETQTADAQPTAAPDTATTNEAATHSHDEHLGAEALGATEAMAAENTETAPVENTIDTAEKPSPKQTEAMAAENPARETPPAADTEKVDDAHPITEAELKTLEAEEKNKEEADDVHLGAESTPGVELEHHKTHPSIH